MAERERTIVSGALAVDIFRAGEPGDEAFYFACQTCGNCGRFRSSRQTATDEARLHLIHHPRREAP